MDIKPFKGLIPDKSAVLQVVSPPYDVVTRVEVKKLIANNPLSFLRITRTDAEFSDDVDEYDDCIYKKSMELLVDFVEDKILKFDSQPSFYLISQKKNGRVQNGIYCLVRCEDYEKGIIKKHELTRLDKEKDRTNHIFETKSDTGPVFLFFRNKGDFKTLIDVFQKDFPDYDFVTKDVEYKLWKISNDDYILKIKDYFKSIDSFYIADGHHRAASAVNVWKKLGKPKNSSYSYFMSVVFPSDEVMTLPYNRVLLNLKMNEQEFLKSLARYFDVMETLNLKPEKKGDIRMFLGDKKFSLYFKGKVDDPVKNLDVSILQEYIFSKILGVDDPRSSKDIDFVGGENSEETILKMIKNKEAKAGFFLHPVDINDLMKISDMGRVMPPKSTWFDPKLPDGLVTYMLEEI